ncbi:MAG: PQQ-binding-like beta-propeller repeat protein [Planctomycetota bacterium]
MTPTPTTIGRRAVRTLAIGAALAAAPTGVAQQPTTATPASTTTPASNTPRATDAPKTEAPQAAPARRAADSPEARKAAIAALDARYVMSPSVADDFGLRIVWQTEPLATKGAGGQVVVPGSDSYWFGDSAGSVVRIRRDNGETVWRASTNQGIERMLTIEHLPNGRLDNVYVLTEMASITLDAGTGNLIRRSRFAHLPSATPAVFGPAFIYGTGTGLASWFQYGTGYNWRATTLGGRVIAPVTVSGQVAMAGSTNGTVHAMDAATAGVRWTRRLSAGVEAPIAIGSEACYVASRDQSLWAFDLDRGRVLWQYFTQSPLLHPPAAIGDGVYLQIPGEGLVAFNPLPGEKPEGEVRWKSKAAGDVIGRMGTELLCWDAGDRALSAVDAGTGRIVRTARLPKAEVIRLTSPMDGDLVVMSKEGAVQRIESLGKSQSVGASASVSQNAP